MQKERAEKERVTIENFTSPSNSKKDWPFTGPNSEKIITTKRKSRAIHVPCEEKK
jgi:hypothetical protein